jgi:hypothetical protein
MRKILISIAAIALAGAVQAQQLSYKIQASLEPIFGLADGGAYLEVFGVPNYRTYILPAVAPGDLFNSVAARSASLSAAYLSQFTQAAATFAYDLNAPPVSTTTGPSGAVGHGYDAVGFNVALGDASGATYQLGSATSRVYTRDSGSSRIFSVSRTDPSFPPSPIAGGLVYTDPAPQSFVVDLNALIASDTCQCSTPGLDLTGVGPLPVHLQGPGSYRPMFMGLSYVGSRQVADPVNATLPNPLQPALYDRFQQLSVGFDGEFTWTIQAPDYDTPEAFAAAQAWIDTNIQRISFEQNVTWQITSTEITAVPEPTTLALWAAGGLLLLGRWRQIHNA